MVRASTRAAKQHQADLRRRERELARAVRLSDQHARAEARFALQDARAMERERKAQEKVDRQDYLLDRQAEAEELTLDSEQRVEELQKILAATLEVDDRIDFSSLLIREKFPPYYLPAELKNPVQEPSRDKFMALVAPRSLMEKALGMKKRHERDSAEAQRKYESAFKAYESAAGVRKAELERHQKDYEADKAAFELKVAQRKAEVDELETAYRAGDPDTISIYLDMVLDRSIYPEGFPDVHRVAYIPESKQAVVELDLPNPDIVPETAEYKYVRTRDEIDEKPRKPAEIAKLYRDVVAQTALRTLHEVFESDQANHLELCVFNGFVHRVNPSTGQDERVCLISVRAQKQDFNQINLARVEPAQCLRNLGAQVSPRPEEAIAVKPVIEFDMADPRFIEQQDVLDGLDQRPNLMDLAPTEFEALVSNLFGKMGLDTKQTRASRDGGVDAVAFDTRPVLGGKVVIQAKRYRNTVGVSAVRDLYGTMLNEGASKGILVATSSYGSDAYKFSEGKPMELIDGGGLLYLLQEVGIKARIVMPVEG